MTKKRKNKVPAKKHENFAHKLLVSFVWSTGITSLGFSAVGLLLYLTAKLTNYVGIDVAAPALVFISFVIILTISFATADEWDLY